MTRARVFSIIAVTSAIFLAAQDYCALGASDRSGAPGSEQSGSLLEASPTWVVVNLFGGRTSKQAERVKQTFERLGAGRGAIILPYRDVTVDSIEALSPAFIALSPNGTPWCRYKGRSAVDLQNFLNALRIIIDDLGVPVVGICGGHQALALAFGGKVGPILGGEDDCFPYGKRPTEKGRKDMEVLQADPIFTGMGKTVNVVQSHYDEVKRIPKGFIWLAGNKVSRYQIIRHPTRPAYGIQAHTEYYHTSRPDGGLLLRNFIEIARTHNRVLRSPAPKASQTGSARLKVETQSR